MPRPKSPCGTYPAYQRHLREKSDVDPACRRAQQEHDGRRSRSVWARAVEQRPAPRAPSPEVALSREQQLREAFRKCVADLVGFVEDDYLYGVIDVMAEMEELLGAWCDAADEVEYDEGFPLLSEDLRARLLVSGAALYGRASASGPESAG